MIKMPSRYSHFVYGVIQSGLTCSIAAAISSIPFAAKDLFLQQWLKSWGISWLTMLPVVLGAAPLIRRLVAKMTRNS
jgi:hypothetical protein